MKQNNMGQINFTGVNYNKKSKKYYIHISINKIKIFLGKSLTQMEGAIIRNEYIIKNNLTESHRLNFPPEEPENTIPNTRLVWCNGEWAIVDDYNYEWIAQYNWNTEREKYTNYAIGRVPVNGKNKNVYMHRLILGTTDIKIDIDHKNGNGMHNYNENIRECNRSQNQANRSHRCDCVAKLKGVEFMSKTGNYMARGFDGKVEIYLGYFKLKIDAGRAYNNWAIGHFKEFANLNKDENGNIL